MNISKGSMIEIAIAALKEKGEAMKFADLWAIVKEKFEISPEEEAERIGHFYSDLSLSGETIVLSGNIWDLRSRHTYEEYSADLTDVYDDVNEKDDDSSDEQEDKEYDAAINGTLSSEEESTEESDEESKSGDDADSLGLNF